MRWSLDELYTSFDSAEYQEDVKKLVAYSSIGIMGYILFALAMMTHLGWLTAITYSIAIE